MRRPTAHLYSPATCSAEDIARFVVYYAMTGVAVCPFPDRLAGNGRGDDWIAAVNYARGFLHARQGLVS